jgi:mono/diheme cytochrome c family protein
VDDFYWLPVSDGTKASFSSFRPKFLLPEIPYFAEKGDVMILAGLHIITKEVNQWTWNTYWWARGEARDAEGYGKDRPKLKEPWSNYVMAASLNPARALAGGAAGNAVFNPYQESQLQNPRIDSTTKGLGGLASNCLSCHQRAAYPITDSPDLITLPGNDPTDLTNRITTEFLWSIVSYHQNQDDGPAKGKQ